MPELIRLPHDFGIADVHAVAGSFRDALDRAGPEGLVLDGTELRQLDSAAAQLLVALLMEGQGAGKTIRMQGASAARLLPAALGADQLDRKTAALLDALDAGSRGQP